MKNILGNAKIMERTLAKYILYELFPSVNFSPFFCCLVRCFSFLIVPFKLFHAPVAKFARADQNLNCSHKILIEINSSLVHIL